MPVFEAWRVLYDMEPWADERADWAADELAAVMFVSHGLNPRGPGEYMRFLKKAKSKPQSEADMKANFAAACAAMEAMEKKRQARGSHG